MPLAPALCEDYGCLTAAKEGIIRGDVMTGTLFLSSLSVAYLIPVFDVVKAVGELLCSTSSFTYYRGLSGMLETNLILPVVSVNETGRERGNQPIQSIRYHHT